MRTSRFIAAVAAGAWLAGSATLGCAANTNATASPPTTAPAVMIPAASPTVKPAAPTVLHRLPKSAPQTDAGSGGPQGDADAGAPPPPVDAAGTNPTVNGNAGDQGGQQESTSQPPPSGLQAWLLSPAFAAIIYA